MANGKYRLDADGELEKRCAQCREYWPADTEFFYPTSSDRDGLGSWCKACSQEKRAAKKAAGAGQ